MKILHVIGQRPEKTGSGIYLQAMANELKKRDFSNYLVAGVPLNNTPDLKNIPADCCQYVYFESDILKFPVTGMSDVMPYESSLFKDLNADRLVAYKTAFSKALRKAVDLYRPDIIHTHHLLVLTALTRKLFPDIPVITTCHGTDLRQYNNCEHLREYVKKYCCQIDRIISLTHDQKTDIIQLYNISPDKISTISSGYDDKIFYRSPKAFSKRVHILYAGKFNRSKGVPWLLKSLIQIKEHDWHLHMAGSGRGPEYDECIALSKMLGNQVTIHGYVTHHQLSTLMKKAHIQILPSFFEGLPLVLFEGLASGCRIITTKLSGFEEIFGSAERDTIELIQLPELEAIDKPFEEDERRLETALTQKIIEMISRVKESPDYQDPQAEKISADYTWEQVFNRILSEYQKLMCSK
ncbi:MAG: glycosyltransferase family 4 protein [Proteobacteria bacterium]|nr:glycosyltransferase family 4 protein [Pseudomonadota bacterium]